MKNNKILFSIVVLTYNREKFIENCLQTLTTLDFPKNKYEVIVVDDGSTDKTASIVEKFPVKLIKHKMNKGISAGRNTGLKNAKGSIYICFDDDCYVSKDWLKKLEKAYRKTDIKRLAGMSGTIKPRESKDLIERYMADTDYGNPSPVYFGKSKNPIKRFFSYMKSMYSQKKETKEIFEVGEIWGANCSFPIEILKGVRGWDEKLSGVEDTDLCDRIKKKYKNKKFFCSKDATLYHDHRLSLISLFEKPFGRGPSYYKFYRKKKTFPPIFPFPILTLLITAFLAIINPLLLIPSVILLPQIFYSWWIIRAIKEKNLYQILFPYIQFGFELATILGLFRGWLADTMQLTPRKQICLTLIFSLLANALILKNIQHLYIREIVSLLYILTIPGLLFSWSIKQKFSGFWELITHIVGLSVIFLMLIGLGINTIYRPLGQLFLFMPTQTTLSTIKPLTMFPLLTSIDIVVGTFSLFLFIRNIPLQFMGKISISRLTAILSIIPIFFPLLTIFGALRLNENGSNILTVIMLSLIALLVILLTIFRSKVKEFIFPYSLFFMALSLLFMTSLRGWYITGHDIYLEYFIFQVTKIHGIWQMANFQDPYNACLSITILPTVIANITHIPDMYIYKVVFQILFALSIPVTYLFIRRLLNPFLSFIASFAIVSLPTFMTDMPMLNRQEIALLFFGFSLYTLFNKQLGTLKKWILFVLFGLGMLLSHYSTTYIGIALFIGGFLIYIPFHLTKLHPKATSISQKLDDKLGFIRSKQNLRLDAVILLLVATIIWNTSITNTAQGITTTITKVTADLQKSNYAKSKNDPASYGLLGNKKQSPQQLLDGYVNSMTTFVRKFNNDTAFIDKSIWNQYPVTVGSQMKMPLTSIGYLLDKHHLNVFTFNDSLKQVYAKFIQLFIVFGFLAVFLFKKHITNFEKEYYLLTITFFIILVFEIVLPGGSIDYGILRLFQQGMILFAVPLVMGGLAQFSIFNKIHREIKYYLLSLTFIFFFLYLSGIIPQLTGGYYPQLNLENGGFYYDAYYTHTQDLIAMDWLGLNGNLKTPVQSDWFTLKRFHTYENFYSIEGLTPSVIRKNSYVYLSYSNLEIGQVITYINGAPVYYKYNFDLLNNNKNLIYSNGGVKIYR